MIVNISRIAVDSNLSVYVVFVLHTIFSPYCLSPSGGLAAPEDVRLVNKSVIFIYSSFFRANEVDFFQVLTMY